MLVSRHLAVAQQLPQALLPLSGSREKVYVYLIFLYKHCIVSLLIKRIFKNTIQLINIKITLGSPRVNM